MRSRILLAFALLLPLSCSPAFADDGGVAIGSGPSMGEVAGSATAAPTATVPSLPDPVAHPDKAVTSAWGLVHQYGWLWGVMIVLFGIGTAIVKLNDEKHWLSQDHTLPIVVGLLGTLGAALQAKFAGGSWAGVFVTGFGALMLLIQKPKPKPATA